jgi:hypothetical protein
MSAADYLKLINEAQRQLSTAVTATAVEPTPVADATFLEPFDTLGYLQLVYELGDWLDIKLIHETKKYADENGQMKAETRDHFQSLEELLPPTTPDQIADLQNDGWHVYITMNAFVTGVNRRLKKNVAAIRTVYIEFDENGDAGLDKIDADVKAGVVPEPHFILESSPGKYYVIWRVSGFEVRTQETLNRALVQRYGSDPQSVDAARVLRLPGTRNLKAAYSPTPVVEIIQEAPGERYTPEDFKVERVVPPEVDRKAAPEKVQLRMALYEEACDNAGVDAGMLTEKGDGSYNYVVACPNYEEHTTGGEYDGSVWISPSGTISYACFHAHCADKKWTNYYRPWLEQQAEQNGYKGKLKFGESSEIEEQDSHALNLTQKPEVPDIATASTSSAAQDVGVSPVSDVMIPLRSMTDLGNAERLVDSYGDDIRYCDETGKWFTWANVRWAAAGKSGPQSLMHRVVRRIYEESANLREQASTLNTPEAIAEARALRAEATKLWAWAKRSESNNAISGAISLARGLRGIRVSMKKFDARPYLFNLQNGTYNLKTHEFHSHEKQDLITKVSPVIYDPNATCPMWEAFLSKSVPSAATRRFLQQAMGYTLTGDTSEDCLFLNIGNGRNGKGVFLNTLKYLMGDYALQANFDSFTARKGGGGLEVRTDIARMVGARFVTASENDQDSRLAEGLLKTLTGSDTITARKLYVCVRGTHLSPEKQG